ncbi:hypothetical protein [Desulfoplanes formicivorans]|uniref:Cwf19-like C-terminal domain-containing protein n=1 Tax=Desulfoplanes formicivorans TaxID=1592317 RepID=A0A194AGB1_9BACT|nr:hypothetical protein [Desulfoplanes formicivorans]GAU08245.1 hypothetical protein DPF_0948 [Desulfoplanes formicivorans]
MHCSICNELLGVCDPSQHGLYAEIVANQGTILFSTDNFSIIPSIGAINKSHVLIVPNRHLLSIASTNLEYHEELVYIKKILQRYNIERCGQSLLFFEHGTGSESNNAGACVEHAHLHGIFDIENFHRVILEEIEMIYLSSSSEIYSLADFDNGYLYYEDSSANCWLANNPDAPSQYFRYLYSKLSNVDLEWNWKKNANIQSVNEVINYYNDIKSII